MIPKEIMEFAKMMRNVIFFEQRNILKFNGERTWAKASSRSLCNCNDLWLPISISRSRSCIMMCAVVSRSRKKWRSKYLNVRSQLSDCVVFLIDDVAGSIQICSKLTILVGQDIVSLFGLLQLSPQASNFPSKLVLRCRIRRCWFRWRRRCLERGECQSEMDPSGVLIFAFENGDPNFLFSSRLYQIEQVNILVRPDEGISKHALAVSLNLRNVMSVLSAEKVRQKEMYSWMTYTSYLKGGCCHLGFRSPAFDISVLCDAAPNLTTINCGQTATGQINTCCRGKTTHRIHFPKQLCLCEVVGLHDTDLQDTLV